MATWPAPPTGDSKWRIGFLSMAQDKQSLVLGPLRQELDKEGASGDIVEIFDAYAQDDPGKLNGCINEIMTHNVHMIVTGSTPATDAALSYKGSSLTLPIIMAVSTPPEWRPPYSPD